MQNFVIHTSLLEKAANVLHLENTISGASQTWEEKRRAETTLNELKPEMISDSQKLISDFFDAWREVGDPVSNITQELDKLKEAADSSWHPTITTLRELLLKQAVAESKKRSLGNKIMKQIRKYYLLVIFAAIILFAFSVRCYSAVEVNNLVTEKSGLVQRAAAFKKILRYESWMLEKGVRKGWPLKRLVYWPIEPTEEEIHYAEEFIGATKEVYEVLLSQSAICDVPASYLAHPMSAPEEVLNFIQKKDFASQTSQIEDSIKLIEIPFVEKFPCSK